MRNRFKSVLAFILTATLLASCANQPDVTETTELTETELIEEIADIAQEEPEEGETKKAPLFPEFKYEYEISEAQRQHSLRQVHCA